MITPKTTHNSYAIPSPRLQISQFYVSHIFKHITKHPMDAFAKFHSYSTVPTIPCQVYFTFCFNYMTFVILFMLYLSYSKRKKKKKRKNALLIVPISEDIKHKKGIFWFIVRSTFYFLFFSTFCSIIARTFIERPNKLMKPEASLWSYKSPVVKEARLSEYNE